MNDEGRIGLIFSKLSSSKDLSYFPSRILDEQSSSLHVQL